MSSEVPSELSDEARAEMNRQWAQSKLDFIGEEIGNTDAPFIHGNDIYRYNPDLKLTKNGKVMDVDDLSTF